MTTTIDTPATEHGAVAFIALNRLKKSPRNARKTPHSPDAIEALAASIKTKTMLQSPVVEPEYDEQGQPTGDYFVTIGEGRRQAQLLRAKRKEIKKTELIRCVIDTENDAHEISLDENVTRSNMHPADQFEAFQRLGEERGLGAEEIAARFGVTATVVRQRLKLAAVSPRLMQTYRNGDLTLDQLMAFTVNEDHARQEGLWESLQSWDRDPHAIRRHLTRDRVSANDRRALFVGVEAYQGAGGVIARDLFAEDHGGYFEDPALLDRLMLEKLQALAEAVVGDGWKWASFETDHGLARLRPQVRDFTPEAQARYDALQAEQEAFEDEQGDWTEDAEVRYEQIAALIEALDASRLGFAPEDKARAGAFVTVGHDGAARIDYGFVRAEDVADEPEPDAGDGDDAGTPARPDASSKEVGGRTTLSDALVADLTAHRTAALRDALAQQPETALCALLHLFVLRTFDCGYCDGSCLDVRPTSVALSGYAPGIEDTPAGRALAERHEGWTAKLGAFDNEAWAFVTSLDAEGTGRYACRCEHQTKAADNRETKRSGREGFHRGLHKHTAQAIGVEVTTTHRRKHPFNSTLTRAKTSDTVDIWLGVSAMKTACLSLLGLLLASGATVAGDTKTLLYDAQGRLIAATRATTPGASDFAAYTLDDADNRLSRAVAAVPVRAAQNELRISETMIPAQSLVSLDGRFQLVFQGDGNVVLNFGSTPLWATTTATGRSMYLAMQSDGNLVLYDPATAPLWNAGTGGHPGAKLVVQNDGNLVIYDGATAIWSTGTCCY